VGVGRRGPSPGPPVAPPIQRRVRIHRVQAFGVPVMALIPLLALLGACGGSEGRLDLAPGPEAGKHPFSVLGPSDR
jgi:hypothetical protein